MDFSKGLLGSYAQPQSVYERAGANIAKLFAPMLGIEDPELKLRTILSQTDTNDPASLRAAAQAAMAQGNIDLGMKLAGQAQALTQRAEDVAFRQEDLDLRKAADKRAAEAAKWESYTKNPQLAVEAAGKETDPAKIRELLMFAAGKLTDKEYARAVERARISASDATAAQARANIAKGEESGYTTEDGQLLVRVGKKYYTIDGKEYTGPTKERLKLTGQAAAVAAAMNKGDPEVGGKGKGKGGQGALNAMTGKTESNVEPSVPSRSSAGQMGRNRVFQSNYIPEPPPRTTRGGTSNPAYDEWERLYGAMYRAQMAGQ